MAREIIVLMTVPPPLMGLKKQVLMGPEKLNLFVNMGTIPVFRHLNLRITVMQRVLLLAMRRACRSIRLTAGVRGLPRLLETLWWEVH